MLSFARSRASIQASKVALKVGAQVEVIGVIGTSEVEGLMSQLNRARGCGSNPTGLTCLSIRIWRHAVIPTKVRQEPGRWLSGF